MGRKITIDSASMMNKALEIIEAHWLFDVTADQIAVMVHPQSVVHSFVEFADHSVLAQLGPPDMKTPIQYALTYPARPAGCSDAMDWTALSQLTFEQPDFDRFVSLRMAFEVVRAGGTAGAVFNAANEAVDQCLQTVDHQHVDDLETVLEADRQAREQVLTSAVT